MSAPITANSVVSLLLKSNRGFTEHIPYVMRRDLVSGPRLITPNICPAGLCAVLIPARGSWTHLNPCPPGAFTLRGHLANTGHCTPPLLPCFLYSPSLRSKGDSCCRYSIMGSACDNGQIDHCLVIIFNVNENANCADFNSEFQYILFVWLKIRSGQGRPRV